MKRYITSLILLLSLVEVAQSQLSIPRIFSNHMVLQCDTPVPIWGTAKANEKVIVTIGGNKLTGQSDSNGKWKITIPSHAAGETYNLVVSSLNEEFVLTDVVYGDVWLCGGQSNMEWFTEGADNAEKEIKNADYPNIRLFDVPHSLKAVPATDFTDGEWTRCSPSTVPQFTAVGYYFGRALEKNIDKPIGLISDNFGGTIVEAWTSADGLYDIPHFQSGIDELKTIDFEKAKSQGDEVFNAWISRFYSDDKGIVDSVYLWAGAEYDYTSWPEMALPTLWESSNDKSLHEKDGVMWFQRTFDLSEVGDATLSLGPIDDTDMTWINGQLVGKMYNRFNKDRIYDVDKSVLKKGENTIVIRVEDYVGGGGLYGKKSKLFIKIEDTETPLHGLWKYQKGMIMDTPIPSNSFGPNNYPTCLYNGMIAPITDFPIKGVIWYQGESNSYRAFEYRELFSRLILDWRKQWNNEDLSFIWVQLANFRAQSELPTKSEWAELREAQAMALKLPHTAMITAIDIGEEKSIHPTNKQEVGKRLADAAQSIAYYKDTKYQGPTFKSMKKSKKCIEIEFSDIGDGLIAKDKFGYLYGFSIAGEDKAFHWAKAKIVAPNKIEVSADAAPNPVAVRYSWQDNPAPANLYNSDELPAFPFRTDDWEISTYEIKRF